RIHPRPRHAARPRPSRFSRGDGDPGRPSRACRTRSRGTAGCVGCPGRRDRPRRVGAVHRRRHRMDAPHRGPCGSRTRRPRARRAPRVFRGRAGSRARARQSMDSAGGLTMREPHDPRAGAAPSMRGRAGLLCLPAAAWLLAFVFVPLVLIGAVSFLSRGDYGEVRLPFTIGNYARLAGWSELGFDPLYLRVLARTLLLACVITAATIAVAVPVAFQIEIGRASW